MRAKRGDELSDELSDLLFAAQEARDSAVEIVERYAMIDGAHHKQWVIDQMLRALLGEHYAQWKADYNKQSAELDYAPWDEGIAP